MKKQKGSVAVIILIILLVVGGGYLYINNTGKDTKEVSQSDTFETLEQETTQTTKKEEGISPSIRTFRVLENTKTYSNDKYNYSVSYPENFVALESLGFMKGYTVADGDDEDRVMIAEAKSNFDPENISI
jgi:predicted AlkP superfamily phosphohydrolase/phosphomutase